MNATCYSTQLEAFTQELKAEYDQAQEAMRSLREKHRSDEAKFAQIESNVLDIFIKMAAASAARSKGSDDGQASFVNAFEGYLEKIPQPWAERKLKCEQHDLPEEAHIESIKLEKIAFIRAIFEKHFPAANRR